MSISRQVEEATRLWVAKGHKKNRRRQQQMMRAFAAHAEAAGARDAGQVGGRTVIAFWKRQRAEKGLSWATQMDYWRAIRELWRLWGKAEEPPKPHPSSRHGRGEPGA